MAGNPQRFKIPLGNLHPSEIQNFNINALNNTQNKRTILSVQKEREKSSSSIDLQSPGKFNFSEDNGDTKIAGSNTKHMFKNLYGETPLTFLYFSDKNIENVQNLIKYQIFKEVGQKIDNQNVTELMIIMRSIFLSYSNHPPLIDESMKIDYKNALLNMYTKEVQRLNELVLNETVPKIISGLQQYLHYLKDSTTPLFPISRPENMSTQGTKQYRSITNILTGNIL